MIAMKMGRLAGIAGSIALALLCALPSAAEAPNRLDALSALASSDVEARQRAIIEQR